MVRSIIEIATEVFQVDPDTLNRDSTPDDVEKWDSLAHLRLITAVEAEFVIRLSMQQIQNVRNLGDLEEAVASNAAVS